MVYAPQTQSGRFFNDQEREVASHQWVEALSFSHHLFRGDHVSKVGIDLQQSQFPGFQRQPADRDQAARRLARGADGLRRPDAAKCQRSGIRGVRAGSLARRLARDLRARHATGSRSDRRDDQLVAAGRGGHQRPARGPRHLRGGYGNFVQRTPLNVGAFTSFESRTVVRVPADGSVIAPGPDHVPQCHRRRCFERRKRMSATSNGTSGSDAGRC